MAPFESTTSARYGIVITDGGPGDLDGVANGACEVSVGVCFSGPSSCDGWQAESAAVRVRGGGGREARRRIEAQLSEALATLAPGALPAEALEIPRCTSSRLSVAADDGASTGLRFRVAARDGKGKPRTRRARLFVECLPGGAGDDSPRCERDRKNCPEAIEPGCGNGVADGGEECDGADARACTAGCSASCTCATDVPADDPPSSPGLPSCGDGARNQAGELCDGADDAICPGECNPDCTCGTVTGTTGNGHEAVVEASSAAHAVTPADAAVDGVVGGIPGNPEHEWIAASGDEGAWLRLTWPEPVAIEQVILHDRPNGFDNVTRGRVVTDDGHAVDVPALPPDGAPLAVVLGGRTVKALTFFVLQASGLAGLSEIEVVQAAAISPAYNWYYISPSGNDSATGRSPSEAWRTFARAIPELRPGDRLVLADGTYTRGTTGLPVIDCSRNARNGEPYRPIILMAANERRAHLRSDGLTDALYMTNCRHWNLWGLHASSSDNRSANPWESNVIRVTRSHHVNMRRLLAVHPNRTCGSDSSLPYCNAHAIAIEHSHHLLLAESEAYDFHRHGVSVFASRWVTVRRVYMNPWGAPGGGSGAWTGVILYGSSDSLIENVIGEGVYGINIAGGTTYDGTPGGYRNRVLGVITLDANYGSTVRARHFGGPVLPAGHNTIRDTVYARTQNVGLYARGAADTVLENVTVFGTEVASGVAADEDLGEGAPCSSNPEGCSITARNLLSFRNAGRGMSVSTAVVREWLLEHSNLYGNGAGNFPTSESSTDDAGNIRRSQSVAPTGMGLSAGQCLLWVPDSSNMKRAGRDGRDIGATILYRYMAGRLTNEPLWNRSTGRFPCGATVSGVNDTASRSCIGVHQRLNVNTNGCPFPAGY